MEFKLPEIGEGVYEAELVEWLVAPGDQVTQGQSLVEVMTDKATMPLASPFTGQITELRANDGDDIKVGDTLLIYRTQAPVEQRNATKKKKSNQVSAQGNGESSSGVQTIAAPIGAVRAAPSVRRMARQLGINLAEIHGTGSGGRVLIDDVTAFINSSTLPVNPHDLSRSVPKADSVVDVGQFRPGTQVKLKGLRRKIADHMLHAVQTIPHYSYVDQCDVTELVRLRESLKQKSQQAGVKLTYLAFIVKAVVEALKEVPLVNATLDDDAGVIRLHDDYHIGIATSTRDGLIVPVIRDADQKDLMQIARDIDRLSTSAREGKTSRKELTGGTFTVTSIGNIGGLISTPIINHPEVGILGVGKIVKQPVYNDAGEIIPADTLYLSFSFDHRVLDGAIGATFGNRVVAHLQNPACLLLTV